MATRTDYMCQTNPMLPTVLAILAFSDVLTIPAFPELEQLFAKMRIAVNFPLFLTACFIHVSGLKPVLDKSLNLSQLKVRYLNTI